jgi:general secretion pathway protein G
MNKKMSSARSARAGFTLIELMVVLLILAMLATIAAPRVTNYLRKAKAEAAKIQVDALSSAIDAYHLDMGRFPTQDEGLKALVDAPAKTTGTNASSSGLPSTMVWDGPYIKKRESLIDPWGHPYRYRIPGQHGDYDVFTLGSDDQEGGDGDARDVGNW